MKLYKTLGMFLIIMFGSAGCTTSNKGPPVIEGNIPESSPFSKIQIGMSQQQVHDILGQPTDRATHTTGKVFIPFYFGNDMMRFDEFYKGMGKITFTGLGVGGVNLKVYSVIYDSNEDGYSGN